MAKEKILFLTTPRMEGSEVKDLQKALAGSYFGNFKPGSIDGVFGETTAGAVRRAKRWLGYPRDTFTGDNVIAGEKLLNYLTGKERLPASYIARRKTRLRRAGKTPLRVRALQLAVGQLGKTENPPDSNRSYASEWYGMIGPWCAMAVTWAYVHAMKKWFPKRVAKTFSRGVRYAYCPYMVRDARYGANGMSLLEKDEVKPGHIVMFDWQKDGVSDHTGIFEKWIDRDNGLFYCIEGNTSVGNDSNGGRQMRRERYTSQVIAFIQAE